MMCIHKLSFLSRHGALICGALLMFTGVFMASLSGQCSDLPARQSVRFSGARLMDMIKVLSSDEFEGRGVATKGEKLTTTFIEEKFKALGLAPGNPNGTYFQEVPMVGITADPGAQLVFTDDATGKKLALKYGDDFVAWTKRQQPEVSVDSDLIFAGYGVVAPEYQWDDFKNVDVKGKVIIVLVNDPPVPDPNNPAELDPNTFKGKAMTYYGRWTYKFEEAARQGAAGCLVVHQTGPAGYPWDVVKTSNTGEQFDLLREDKGMSRSSVEGWMTYDQAKALFALGGKDFDALAKSAVSRDFRPVPLGARAALTLHNTIRTVQSKNVVAKVEGHDPKLREEYVIYMAHWDHLGVGPEVNGDRIYHGASDNASGVAGLLELARAFRKVQPPPRRSILFLSVTAEEKGLLGSQYYAEHPLYPLNKTLAVINMDVINMLGPTRDITVIGLGMSSLDDTLKTLAARQGRTIRSDPEPGKGFYYRSDHFNFAKQGVPALDPKAGVDYVGKPEGWGMKMLDQFDAEDYHKPSDKIKPYWDPRGALQDLRLFFEGGYRVANGDTFPTWSPGTEFKAKREEMLRKQ